MHKTSKLKLCTVFYILCRCKQANIRRLKGVTSTGKFHNITRLQSVGSGKVRTCEAVPHNTPVYHHNVTVAQTLHYSVYSTESAS